MIDVTIVNRSGQTVALRLDENTARDIEWLAHLRKQLQLGEFSSLEVAPTAGTGPVDLDAVPTGAAKDVLAWVGADAVRAKQALEAEQARDDGGRTTVLSQLNKLVPPEA